MELGVLDAGVLVVGSSGCEGKVGGDGLKRGTHERHKSHQRRGVWEGEEAVGSNGTEPRESREDNRRDSKAGVPVGTESGGCVVGFGEAEELFSILF